MKLGIKAKSYLTSAACGAFSSLFALSAFDVYTMKAFHETSKHPVEYPLMLITGIICAMAAFLLCCFGISLAAKAERKGKLIAADIFVFVICAVLSLFMWSFIIWLFDSDAQMIG